VRRLVATKAAYRFLDNDRVSEAEILARHFQATRERFAAVAGPVTHRSISNAPPPALYVCQASHLAASRGLTPSTTAADVGN